MVGAARFELTTSASQTRRSTRLSYAPVHGRTLEDSRGRIKKFLHKNFICAESTRNWRAIGRKSDFRPSGLRPVSTHVDDSFPMRRKRKPGQQTARRSSGFNFLASAGACCLAGGRMEERTGNADQPGEFNPGALFAHALEGLKSTPGSGTRWTPLTVDDLQRELPQYSVSHLIGRGGMGAVYMARQDSLDRDVAIKILPPGIDGDDLQFAGRFKQEARAMAKFKHPGIVSVHDAGETPGGLLYFVMEFIAGTDVGERLAAEGSLPPEEAVRIAAQVCEALAYAHERGVVHRDIKPSNVMLETDGTVKIADFGLAKLTSHDGGGFTRSDMALGSPDFAAPECSIPGIGIDARADIFSAGVMLYQMLTGRLPRGRFDPPSGVVARIDPRLDAVIDKALQTDREKRYASAAEMAAALARIHTVPPRREIRWWSWAAAIFILGLLAWMLLTLDSGKMPATLQLAGTPATLATPPRQWTPVFPDPANITELASLRDGWALRTEKQNYSCVPDPGGRMLDLRNGGVRARRRMPDSFREVLLSVRHRANVRSIELHYSTPKPGNPESRLEIRENRMDTLPPNPSPEQRWAACVLLAEIQFPNPGNEVSCELIAVGKTVIGRLNNHTVTCTLTADASPGGMILRQAAVTPFRNFESINLDGQSEAEALKSIRTPTP